AAGCRVTAYALRRLAHCKSIRAACAKRHYDSTALGCSCHKPLCSRRMDSFATHGNARDGALKNKTGLLLVFAALTICPALWADGGTVVLQKRSGPFIITLFSD